MDVSVENTSTLGRRIKVSVSNAQVDTQIKVKMSKLSREANLKGFRPGKVPPGVLQQKFGDSVRLEVINELIRQSFGEAVQKNELKPAGSFHIEELKNQAGQDLEFIATFEVYPQIVLGDISAIIVEKRIVEIQDEDVANMILKLQDQLAQWIPVTRATLQGDKLTVDFSRLLQIDGATREEQKGVQLIIGGAGVLEGLSEALKDKNIGSEVEISLHYPDSWPEEAAAGKDVKLWVTINHIAQKKPLTKEELAGAFGIEKDNDEKLKELVRQRMQEELDQTLQDELQEKVLEKLLESNPIELPLALIEQEKEAIRREVSRSRRQNIPKEALPTEQVAEQAKHRVELGLLLNEVIKKYNLQADGQRVRKQIEKIAAKFSKPAEIVEAYYNSNEMLYSVERVVLLEQAVAALLDEVKVNELKASFSEVMTPVEEAEEQALIA